MDVTKEYYVVIDMEAAAAGEEDLEIITDFYGEALEYKKLGYKVVEVREVTVTIQRAVVTLTVKMEI